eukprot:11800461-Ditylum_brightwellii.AAC.1
MLKDKIIEVTEGNKTKVFLVDHYIIPDTCSEDVDWKAIKLARGNTSFFHQRWASRWCSETIPTGTEMEDRGTWQSAHCP